MARSPLRCVADSNVWIDLHRGQVLPSVFELPIEWSAPDVILAELTEPIAATLLSLGLGQIELTGDHVAGVEVLAERHTELSRADLFALVAAKIGRATLITGDQSLREPAALEGLRVHGTLWVLDQLVGSGTLTRSVARAALDRIVLKGRRLPRTEVARMLARLQRR